MTRETSHRAIQPPRCAAYRHTCRFRVFLLSPCSLSHPNSDRSSRSPDRIELDESSGFHHVEYLSVDTATQPDTRPWPLPLSSRSDRWIMPSSLPAVNISPVARDIIFPHLTALWHDGRPDRRLFSLLSVLSVLSVLSLELSCAHLDGIETL